MLGSFPPPKERWCMDFFYPNPQNDMWRIMGQIFFDDKEHFLEARPTDGKRVFARRRIEAFLRERQIAMYDTAVRVIRQRGNASDAFLTVVEPLDLERVLRLQLPSCQALITTGEKATQTLSAALTCPPPPVGGFVDLGPQSGRSLPHSGLDPASPPLRFYRMPSTSRAYPLPLEKKAEAYCKLFK